MKNIATRCTSPRGLHEIGESLIPPISVSRAVRLHHGRKMVFVVTVVSPQRRVKATL